MLRIAQLTKHVNGTLLEGARIINKTVELKGLCDFRPGPNGPTFDATTIFMNNCDQNFVFHWLTPKVFPNARNILIDGHPSEQDVFRRFPDVPIYLPERYKKTRFDVNGVNFVNDQFFDIWHKLHELEPLYIVAKN